MLRAKDTMNRNVLVVPEDMGVRELANLLSDRMITGAPVIDQQKRVVGVVSTMDIARYYGHENKNLNSDHTSRPAFYLREWDEMLDSEELERFHVEETDDPVSVSEIMTPIVFEVSEDTPLGDIAQMMVRGRIHRVIVTRDRAAVGIVTSLDILKVLAETPDGLVMRRR